MPDVLARVEARCERGGAAEPLAAACSAVGDRQAQCLAHALVELCGLGVRPSFKARQRVAALCRGGYGPACTVR